MTEQRFVDLETKLAQQEHLLLELNDIITKQQENIMRLEKLCDSIIQRVRSLSEAAPVDTSVDEKPPHY
jgi:SlyX protein